MLCSIRSKAFVCIGATRYGLPKIFAHKTQVPDRHFVRAISLVQASPISELLASCTCLFLLLLGTTSKGNGLYPNKQHDTRSVHTFRSRPETCLLLQPSHVEISLMHLFDMEDRDVKVKHSK